MPIYEYKCGTCCHNYELRRGFDEGSVAPCPKCEGEGRRIFTPVPIIFKGPGFYVNDYKKDEDSTSQSVPEETVKKNENANKTKDVKEEGHGED